MNYIHVHRLTELSETLLNQLSLLLFNVCRLFPQIRCFKLELIVGLSQFLALLSERVHPGGAVALVFSSSRGLSVSLSRISSVQLQKILFLTNCVLQLSNLLYSVVYM